jgi:hypothetical protein
MLSEAGGPSLRKVLPQMFITSTGAGDIQIEWEIGDRYFEVEIPARGPFSYLSEKAGDEREGSIPDEPGLLQMLQGFWTPSP